MKEDTSNESMTNEELRINEYPFTVRPLSEEDGGGYLIEYPDIPGCMSDGETPEEAVVNGRDALRCALLTLMEFNETIPEPGSKMLPSDLRDRLNTIADKRHVRPADLISEALSKMESAA
jgi:antitoxin HicB